MDQSKIGSNEHLGSKTVSENEDVDIEDMIEKSGCNDIYMKLEECLGEADRDWRKCQVEVPIITPFMFDRIGVYGFYCNITSLMFCFERIITSDLLRKQQCCYSVVVRATSVNEFGGNNNDI